MQENGFIRTNSIVSIGCSEMFLPHRSSQHVVMDYATADWTSGGVVATARSKGFNLWYCQIMSIGKKLANERFTVIVVLGFTVFVMSWLYGLRDFKNPFKIRFNFCTSAWNPKAYGSSSETANGPKWTQECALAAAERRNDIVFFGALAFVLLVIGFMLLTWRAQEDN